MDKESKMITYSFIIPHHNSPTLLDRCLASIPQRDDIEVVVADDNSDTDKKPRVSRPDVRLIYIDAQHTKGAGRARNYAISEAKGKWLVFADADDFFVAGFLDVLDEYRDTECDVVYHPAKAADTITLEDMPSLLGPHNEYFSKYDGSKDALDLIKFHLHSPWWKMVRRDFVVKHHIQFEEVSKGNDIFFSYQVGYFAKRVGVAKEPIYVYTYNRDGITNGRKNKAVYLTMLQSKLKIKEFYRFIGHEEWITSSWKLWLKMIKKDGIWVFCQTVSAYLSKYRTITASRFYYVDEIKRRQ